MKYYLYQFSDNWADEMDVQGFALLTETQKDIAIAKIKREYKRGGTICFGTNEDNEYDSLEDVMNCVEFTEITPAEYHTLKKFFGESYGETGPLDTYDLDSEDDDEEDIETCEECGDELEPEEDTICASCENDLEEEQYEQSYNQGADEIVKFIKSAYGLESTSSYEDYAKFTWKPTPKTEIEIRIPAYDSGDEELEISLKLKGKEVRYECFQVEDISHPFEDLESILKELIEKAKKY